jgi:hypothetical protein
MTVIEALADSGVFSPVKTGVPGGSPVDLFLLILFVISVMLEIIVL